MMNWVMKQSHQCFLVVKKTMMMKTTNILPLAMAQEKMLHRKIIEMTIHRLKAKMATRRQKTRMITRRQETKLDIPQQIQGMYQATMILLRNMDIVLRRLQIVQKMMNGTMKKRMKMIHHSWPWRLN